VRDGLDEFFGGGTGDTVELGDLSGGSAGDLQSFTFGGELRDEADRLRASGVDAAAGEEEIANEAVAEIALEARNAAKAGNEAETKFGKSEAGHFIGDDDIADEREFESATETDTVNGGDGDERRIVEPIENRVDVLEKIADAFGA